MIITRKSVLTGIERVRDMDISPNLLHRLMQDDPDAYHTLRKEGMRSADIIWLRHGTSEKEWRDFMEDQPIAESYYNDDDVGYIDDDYEEFHGQFPTDEEWEKFCESWYE